MNAGEGKFINQCLKGHSGAALGVPCRQNAIQQVTLGAGGDQGSSEEK